MVLEEATTPQDTASYSESLPTSDLDPYESGNPTYTSTRESAYIRVNVNPPVYVNLNSLPRPFSPFGVRKQPQALTNSIQETCKFATGVLHRPVTQEEADAFAFHLAKTIRVASYGEPVGFGVAMIQAYRTHKEYRFPLWSPMKEGGRSNFSPDRFGPFRGTIARMQWQALRIGAYGAVGAILGGMFYASYAMTVGLAGRTMDPRLKEFTSAVKARMEERRGSVSGEIQKAMEEGKDGREGETAEMARQRVGVQRQSAQRAGRQSSGGGGRRSREVVDDMSPTAGSFEEEFMAQSADSDTGLMSDGQARQQQPTSSFDPDRSAPQTRTSSSSSSSPVSRQAEARQTGSAWERLRQNAVSSGQNSTSTSGRPPASNANNRDSASGNDSFSFSQGEEEKQLARGEAQKQFDERIERERAGQDFDEGRKGWRR